VATTATPNALDRSQTHADTTAKPKPADRALVDLAITAIRTLSIDAVQTANSGHPGTPVAMAPVAYAIWQHCLRFDPADPIWPNRDRFVLSMAMRPCSFTRCCT